MDPHACDNGIETGGEDVRPASVHMLSAGHIVHKMSSIAPATYLSSITCKEVVASHPHNSSMGPAGDIVPEAMPNVYR